MSDADYRGKSRAGCQPDSGSSCRYGCKRKPSGNASADCDGQGGYYGKGGRNQEIALSAASGIDGIKNAAIFSIGSDGTDGPTDAAGGYADADTAGELRKKGINIFDVLRQNDAYNALKETGGLIITGPTGTNVNDVAVLLIDCD